MSTAIAIVGVVVVLAAVLWFMFAHTPEQAAGHAGEPVDPGREAGRDVAGPADAGAEGAAAPERGEVGPANRPPGPTSR